MSKIQLSRPTTTQTKVRTPSWLFRPAEQQPQWHQHPHYEEVNDRLACRDGLVTPAEIHRFTAAMARVAAGEAQILQMGDCAEEFHERIADRADEKLRLLTGFADELDRASDRPVLRIGRLGGQFAKPRSKPTEMHGGVELPVFRGHLINSEEATEDARRHDPRRMLHGYDASVAVHKEVRRHRDNSDRLGRGTPGPWSSHEALVIDYEDSLIRSDIDGHHYLASTHFPWVGDRTRQPHGSHIALLASVGNPVGCKLGPTAQVDDVLRVCQALDPDRRPGRLALIVRMGTNQVRHALPAIVEAVAAANHPVIWMCDPMHGNTVTRSGVKTRLVDDIVDEVVGFRTVLRDAGTHAGGLHLETAGSAVTECIGQGVDESHLNDNYESLCDPRLNVQQTREVIATWTVALPEPEMP